MALITDQVPPEEEPKAGTGKGEKKAGSRAAKKSAKGSKSGDCCLHVFTQITNSGKFLYETYLKK